jgi:hypothetical protein
MVRRYAHLSTVHLADYVNRRQALSDVSVTGNKSDWTVKPNFLILHQNMMRPERFERPPPWLVE